MERQDVTKAIDELKKQPQKKFSQSYDLIINLKNFNVKQTPLDFFVTMPHSLGKKIKVAAFVEQATDQKACDLIIRESEFQKYAEKKTAKKLGEEYDFFIAQANLMGKIAAAFGKVLGTKGKMPNPKLGCVVPPNANLEPLVKKLETTVHLTAKKATNLQCMVGKQNQNENEIIDNVMSVYQTVTKQLPDETQNIKNVSIKLTMSKPVRI
ncbi:TPA: hypothetical protein HA242_07145 [Candidatus Woesearchaeota archaeon]|nr:hypothetical protein [Candidatus Woesearchaeota archaeon]HIH13471.1 hypothetical protein [Candidatus Woesearchaeota archaeon]